jgi:hypothetical protein
VPEHRAGLTTKRRGEHGPYTEANRCSGQSDTCRRVHVELVPVVGPGLLSPSVWGGSEHNSDCI